MSGRYPVNRKMPTQLLPFNSRDNEVVCQGIRAYDGARSKERNRDRSERSIKGKSQGYESPR